MDSENITEAKQSHPATPFESSVETSPQEPLAETSEPGLTDDMALALLKQPDLAAEALEGLSKSGSLLQIRKIRIGVAGHPNTPRHVSLPLLRHLYTFDLMQVALTPTVPADVKKAADEILVNKLGSISSGERLTLARRGSARIAGALLVDKEPRVMQAALENSRMTEALVVKAVVRHDAPAAFIEAVCHHAKWSVRREIRMALLRSDKTPLAFAVQYARAFPPMLVREILHSSRLPAGTRAYITKELGGASE
jgi:hypothetical protein